MFTFFYLQRKKQKKAGKVNLGKKLTWGKRCEIWSIWRAYQEHSLVLKTTGGILKDG
jgi:hypothetical protein